MEGLIKNLTRGFYFIEENLLGVKENISTSFKLTDMLVCYYCFSVIYLLVLGVMIIFPVLCSLKLYHKN